MLRVVRLVGVTFEYFPHKVNPSIGVAGQFYVIFSTFRRSGGEDLSLFLSELMVYHGHGVVVLFSVSLIFTC